MASWYRGTLRFGLRREEESSAGSARAGRRKSKAGQEPPATPCPKPLLTSFLSFRCILFFILPIMSTDKTVGILGGGQLGRMLAHPAALLSIPLLILDSGANTPAKQVILPPAGHSSHVDGPFTSREHILELASKVDVLTVEIEHVDADVLDEVERAGKVEVHPSPQTIKVIQDKYEQKRYLVEREVAVADFLPVERSATDPSVVERSIQQAARELGLPLMLKARTLAYDGRGNFVLKETDAAAIGRALDFLGDRPLYAERWAPFDREIAVMVVRTPTGEVASYDPVETVHEDSILRLVLCPLRAGGKDVNIRAKQLAEKAVSCLHGAGIFGVEMFLMPDSACNLPASPLAYMPDLTPS